MSNTRIKKNTVIKQQSKETTSFNIDTFYRTAFVFILDVIEYCEILKQHNKQTLADQLLQSATLWGEHINEARYMEHLYVFKKELELSRFAAKKLKYLLQLCQYSKDYPTTGKLITELTELTETIKTQLKIEN